MGVKAQGCRHRPSKAIGAEDGHWTTIEPADFSLGLGTQSSRKTPHVCSWRYPAPFVRPLRTAAFGESGHSGSSAD